MATRKEQLQVGVFEDADAARNAIRDLRAAGIPEKKIGVLTRDDHGDMKVKSFKDLEGNKAGTGAAIGVGAGAGGGALWAIGIAAGVLPAIGPVIAGGLLAAIAASAGIGAAAGAIVGSLVGLGVSDEEAAYYDEEFRKGRTIVVVQNDDRADVVYQLLQQGSLSHPYQRDPRLPLAEHPGRPI
ncbi:MAG TPA: hypothetical protein VIU61_19355 [Kofleriaceae bacterium]